MPDARRRTARSARIARIAIPVLAASALAVSGATSAGATPNPSRFTLRSTLSPTSVTEGLKSTTGRLAQSDPALLKRTDSALVNVVVKLDYDATASYAGGIRGLAATSPRVTGKKLTGSSAAEAAYERYTGAIDAAFRADVRSAIKGAVLGRSLTRVYGGVALRVPADEAKALLKLPNVAAVQTDTLNKPQTVESPTFIGAPTLWSREGGQSLAGQGVIFGDLDTGIWPENPMLADNPALGTPPPAPSGNPRGCNYGDNPLTPAVDVFTCNHKVIGGVNELATYNALVGGEVFPDSARDSNGHGTHTTTTAAGENVTNAPIFGIDRGPISGVAPGAWVIEYKVCGLQGCFGSDSAAAVAQAILDGVNVINFSISGGSSPFTDPVELAFKDAYDAGITVAASAGNSGPGAATTDHHSPWVITVAASTQQREFQSTLSLTGDASTLTLTGSSLTTGISSPLPVVLASSAPYSDAFCGTAATAGSFAGKIVACQRGGGIGRIQKGVNVLAGGAAGMILYNIPLQDTETDNHFLPTVHLADGTSFLAFMAAHSTVTATFTDGVKADGLGDVMASFSSRGPGGLFLKPDITAPGVQILAGNTPVPDEVAGGAPGQSFQAIAGTSMSSPHIAGSAILMKALHPTWGPGAIKSALMTSATTAVLKEDEVTPADPFDDGAGRVDLTKAGDVPIVFQDTAANMAALGADPLTAPEVNTPAVNLPTLSGSAIVVRTADNLSTKAYKYKVTTTAPAGATIKVSPSSGTIKAGASQAFRIEVTSSASTGQFFGQINFASTGNPALHLPVAFFAKQGAVTLSQSCVPLTVPLTTSTTCTMTASNTGFDTAAVSATTSVTSGLKITGATGATVAVNGRSASTTFALAGQSDPKPAIAPGDTPVGGYIPLSAFGVAPFAIGDETNSNFTTPAFTFGGRTYTAIGVDSNGYVVLGGGNGSADISFTPQHLPDPARPNNVLAPYWTDLDGSGTGYAGRVGILTDTSTGDSWLVVDWNVHVFGDTSQAGGRNMEIWIGINGVDDVSYAYDINALGVDAPAGAGLTVGAESPSGQFGAQITGPPASSYVVTATPGTAAQAKTWTVTAKGTAKGLQTVTSSMTSNLVLGTTVVSTGVQVTKK